MTYYYYAGADALIISFGDIRTGITDFHNKFNVIKSADGNITGIELKKLSSAFIQGFDKAFREELMAILNPEAVEQINILYNNIKDDLISKHNAVVVEPRPKRYRKRIFGAYQKMLYNKTSIEGGRI